MPSQKLSKTSSLGLERKVLKPTQLLSLVRRLKSQKKKIVFTNGTFDFLHLGHVQYLEKAKRLGDVLIVGVNTDRSVKTYKDPSRPINPEADRIRVLAALEAVDYAILFDEPTPLHLVCKIQPHVLAKGADWKASQIAGAREMKSWGGVVRRIPLVTGRSTTNLISKIKHV